MPLKFAAKSGAGDYEPVAAGSHIAVCDIVADLGLQPGSQMYPKPKQQVYIRFELPNERIEFEKDGKKQVGPAVIGKTYTASMNEKANLRHDLQSWRGKEFTDEQAEDFDVASVLGKACMISVMHKVKDGKTYANISGIGPLPKGIVAKTLIPEINPVLYTEDNTAGYKLLPEWIQKKIDAAIQPEPKQQTSPDSDDGADFDQTQITDDDIPF